MIYNVNTGDNTNLILLFGLAVASFVVVLALIIVLIIRKKKEKSETEEIPENNEDNIE